MAAKKSKTAPTVALLPQWTKGRAEVKLLSAASAVLSTALIITVFLSAGIEHVLLRSTYVASVVSAVLIDLTNTDRNNNNFRTLHVNPLLVAAAQAKANDMAAKGYFAHVSPDGHDSWYWFKKVGYSFTYAGENLAVDFSDSSDVERAWMNSPTHRDNLLDPHFTEIGVALASGMYKGHQTTFAVQMFGTPSRNAAFTAQQTTVQAESARATLSPSSSHAVSILGQTAVSRSQSGAVSAAADSAPLWGYHAASPRTMLRYAYYILGLLVLGSLFFTTRFEFRSHHRAKFLLAGSMLILMCGLFLASDAVIFSKPIIDIPAHMLGSNV